MIKKIAAVLAALAAAVTMTLVSAPQAQAAGNLACRYGQESFGICVMTRLTPQADGTGYWFQGVDVWMGGDQSEAESCPGITYNLKVERGGTILWNPPKNTLCEGSGYTDVYDPAPFKVKGSDYLNVVSTLHDNFGADSDVAFYITVN